MDKASGLDKTSVFSAEAARHADFERKSYIEAIGGSMKVIANSRGRGVMLSGPREQTKRRKKAARPKRPAQCSPRKNFPRQYGINFSTFAEVHSRASRSAKRTVDRGFLREFDAPPRAGGQYPDVWAGDRRQVRRYPF